MADQHEPDPVSYNPLKTAEPTLPFAWYHDPAPGSMSAVPMHWSHSTIAL